MTNFYDDFKEFKTKVKTWENDLRSYNGKVIVDGLVKAKMYFRSNPKIAWFLKEAYTVEENGFHIKKHYGQEDAYNNFFKLKATQTWHPIIYSSYAILNNYDSYNDMYDIKGDPSMCDVIKQIAIINANKFPSQTYSRTTASNLKKGFEEFQNFLKQQIDLLNPSILIFGGTFHLYKESIFKLTNKHKIKEFDELKKSGVGAWIDNGRLFLEVYHPANTQMKHPDYVDSILRAYKRWKCT